MSHQAANDMTMGDRNMPEQETQDMCDARGRAALEALRAQGAHLDDPVRFRYLEAMAARMQAHPPQVRRMLAERLDAALTQYRQRVRVHDEGGGQAPRARSVSTVAAPSPLAQLNRDTAERAQALHGTHEAHGLDAEATAPAGLKSVSRFAETWSRIATARQLEQALTRGPEAAGPLNSHNLMLRAMSLMNGLSPDYLRRFLAQADALLWLDHLNQHNALGKDAKAGRRGRAKK